MLDYAGCWHRFQFLIKCINYEILLQRITSLCPTREWFVLRLTGQLSGVHLRLISRGGRRSRQAGILGQCKGTIWCQSWTEEHAPAKAPSQAGRCLFNSSIHCLCDPPQRERCLWRLGPELAKAVLSILVPTWKTSLLPLFFQAQQKHSFFQEALSDFFRGSESQPIV